MDVEDPPDVMVRGNGTELTLQPYTFCWANGCDAVEGQLIWNGPETAGQRAAELGEPPFSYTVDLDLYGTTYVGTATWPDDEHPDRAPAVPLTFDPPLPGL